MIFFVRTVAKFVYTATILGLFMFVLISCVYACVHVKWVFVLVLVCVLVCACVCVCARACVCAV